MFVCVYRLDAYVCMCCVYLYMCMFVVFVCICVLCMCLYVCCVRVCFIHFYRYVVYESISVLHICVAYKCFVFMYSAYVYDLCVFDCHNWFTRMQAIMTCKYESTRMFSAKFIYWLNMLVIWETCINLKTNIEQNNITTLWTV